MKDGGDRVLNERRGRGGGVNGIIREFTINLTVVMHI